MKKYTTFAKDLSTLKGEVADYWATLNIEFPLMNPRLYHPLGTTEELITAIPSLADAFSSESLTAMGVAHHRISRNEIAVPAKISILLVPFNDNTSSCKFSICEPKKGALPYDDLISNNIYYHLSDCDIIETIDVGTDCILVNEGSVYSIVNTGTGFPEFLILAFNEDVSSYFSE